jgi:beta-glucosidase
LVAVLLAAHTLCFRRGRAQETYGEDPTLTSKLGAAYVRGMQFMGNTSVGAPLAVRNVAKHFAAYNLESNFAGRKTAAEISQGDGQYRLSYDAVVSNADMMQTFLPAFESVVEEAKIRGVMCGYNSVNGVPLCANTLLQEQLRGRMGFNGIVITDCGAIGMMTGNHHWAHPNGTAYTAVEATAAALAAGTDLNCGSSYGSQLPTAFAKGLVTLAQLDTAVARSMMGHLELGLFQDTAAAAIDPRRQFAMSIVDSGPHRALAKQAAIEAVVLLKNTAKTLPLVPTAPSGATASGGGAAAVATLHASPRARRRKVAVVGPNANRTLTLTSNYAGCKDRAGGPILPSCTFVNPLEGIAAAVKASNAFESELLYAQGVAIDTPDTSGIGAAVAAASQADVTIVVTGLITCQEIGDECQEAEARDRSTPVNSDGTDNPFSQADKGRDYGIGLPGAQLELLQTLANSTNTTIVLVVMSGSAVEVTWAAGSSRVAAIVQHFYAGVLGGEALADVLFGSAPPAGKLPVMVPTSEDQLPTDYLNQSMQAGEGRTHRYFTGKPLYPFGFGLGYSTFTFGELAVSHTTIAAGLADVATVLTVAVSVRNNGEYGRPSDEVVMVYAQPFLADSAAPSMSVPRQILLGFSKVTVASGSTVRVEVAVPAAHLRMVGPDDVAFELLRGRYLLHVGSRSPGGGVGLDEQGLQPLLTADLLIE